MKKRALRWIAVHLIAAVLLGAGVMMYAEEITAVKSMIRSSVQETGVEEQDLSKFDEYPQVVLDEDGWYYRSRMIYHACGGIDGLSYTNSLEALEQTLAQNRRLVEADFLYTSDGALICQHDWEKILGSDSALSLAEFEASSIYGKYTPLTAEKLIDFMRQYEDMYLIIDAKDDDCVSVVRDLLQLCGEDSGIAGRFVIQLYDRGYKAQMLELYPFENDQFLFTAYKFDPQRYAEIMEICYDEQISVVTVQSSKWDAETIRYFCEKGFLVFEHTVNRLDYVEYAVERGVYGFYTDFMHEEDLPLEK